ncbi:MAG: hypothetical protein OEM82_00670 [Acidobacteriota bacterium]|nr:hypothetical protein [Acidobacteriota bacterium]MDH3528775.1 hypothetical protein [Acidobacteriota bacterium]
MNKFLLILAFTIFFSADAVTSDFVPGGLSTTGVNSPSFRQHGFTKTSPDINKGDDDDREKLLKRYLYLKEKVARLMAESRRLFDQRNKAKTQESYDQINARIERLMRELEEPQAELRALKKQLFPCGETDWEKVQASRFYLNVINESKLRLLITYDDKEFGDLVGELSPGEERDLRLRDQEYQYEKDVVRYSIKVVARYPDGSRIPSKEGVRTALKGNFRLTFPEKKPCVRTYRILLTDSDFGVAGVIPEQSDFSIYMDRVSYDGRTLNNGARNDLTVYFTGKPKWPVTAYLTATSCPPNVSCPPVKMTFASSSMKDYNAVIMPKVLYCYGFRRSASIGAEVKLEDSAGNVTLPAAVTTQCIVK